MTLFENFYKSDHKDIEKQPNPLADRMRPIDLSEFVGQDHLVGPGKILRRIIEQDRLFSIILWGPPGCGKTTLARIIAKKNRKKVYCLFRSYFWNKANKGCYGNCKV